MATDVSRDKLKLECKIIRRMKSIISRKSDVPRHKTWKCGCFLMQFERNKLRLEYVVPVDRRNIADFLKTGKSAE